jgi:hypothetical protein
VFVIFLFQLGLERTQENRSHKRKHNADRQHIEPQSEVHVTRSLCDGRSLAGAQPESEREPCCNAQWPCDTGSSADYPLVSS